MKFIWVIGASLLFCMAAPEIASAQDEIPPNLAGAPPKMLFLVRQEFDPGRVAERRKLETDMARACEKLNVPNSWIDLESMTGSPEALSFDPFDSFEDLDAAFAEWKRIYATHPDLARMQEEVKALVSGERAMVAVRRDDLSNRPQSIDFSKARFLRVLEIHLNPGHESDFAEATRTLGGGYEKFRSDVPWVVYHVNSGMPSPSFFIFVPMRTLKVNDDLLDWRRSLRETEGEEATQHAEQIARDAFAFSETNLYVVSPEASHVSVEFAEGDPSFWAPKRPAAAIIAGEGPATTTAKPAPRKEPASKPRP